MCVCVRDGVFFGGVLYLSFMLILPGDCHVIALR